MAYVADPTDPTKPTGNAIAGDMFLELQALKGYIQTQLSSGSNFVGTGSFRNKLLNGNFNVAQRGAGIAVLAGTGVYALDQWVVIPKGAQLVTVSQAVNNGPFANNSSMRMVQASPGTGLAVTNRIESDFCQDLALGGSVTVSGWYKTDSLVNPVPTIALTTPTIVDNWGVSVLGATPAGGPVVFTTPLIVSTWTAFKQTFVLTTDPTVGLALALDWAGTIVAGAVSLYNVQLEKGTAASTFELRAPEVELAMCQRHYQTGHVFLSGQGDIGLPVGTCGYPTVTMRATPIAAITADASNNVISLHVTNVLPTGEIMILANISLGGGFTINTAYSLTCEL